MTINPLKWIGAGLRALVRTELRSSLADPDPWLQWWFNGGGTSKAGVIVNEQTALAFSAVFQAIRVISEAVASLPFPTYRRLSPRGKERVTGHPAYRLLNRRPNPDMPAYVFRETLMGHVLLWGNGYAEIERTGGGVPVALHVLRPDRVYPELDPADRSLVYRVYQPGKPAAVLRPDDVLHLRGLGFDGLVGYSPIRLGRQAIGLGLAAETFGASFFGNGARPQGALKHPGKLSDQAAKHLRESWEATHGGPENANRPAILEEGLEWVPFTVPPEDAQFLGTRQFQVQEVARWFNIAPHKLMDLSRSTNNNIEQQALEFVQHTLTPWLVRWEEEVQAKLFRADEQETLFAEHLLDHMLRGDATARHAAYRTGIQFGYYSADDVREMENLNPLADGKGDLYLTPVNMQPAEVTAEQAKFAESGKLPALDAGATGKPPANPKPPADSVPDGSGDGADATRAAVRAAVRPLLVDAGQRVLRREAETLRRAARKPGLGAFAGRFYAEHADYVRSNFGHLLAGYAGVMYACGLPSCRSWTPAQLDEASGEVAAAARDELLAAVADLPADQLPAAVDALLARWEADRPGALADRLLSL